MHSASPISQSVFSFQATTLAVPAFAILNFRRTETNTLQREHPRLSVHSLERASNLDLWNVFILERGQRTSHRVQERATLQLVCRGFRQQVYIVLVGLGFLSLPQQIKLRQHLVRERTCIVSQHSFSQPERSTN